jgi:hypothetical protein
MENIGYVITGMPRSGTGYISQVLTDIGIECGHEKSYSHNKQVMQRDMMNREWGDASWLAAPHLPTLAAVSGCTLFYQTRCPYRVLDSNLPPKGSLVGEARRRGPYAKYVRRHLQDAEGINVEDERERLLYWFVFWDAMVRQGAHYEYPIEGVDPECLIEIVRLCTGRVKPGELICNVLNNTSRTTNHRNEVSPWAEKFCQDHDTMLTSAVRDIVAGRSETLQEIQ